MAKKVVNKLWGAWDDSQLTNLQSVIVALQSAKFHLELLRGEWNRMDDEVDPIIDQLLQAHQELAEIFENLEEQRDESDDS